MVLESVCYLNLRIHQEHHLRGVRNRLPESAGISWLPPPDLGHVVENSGLQTHSFRILSSSELSPKHMPFWWALSGCIRKASLQPTDVKPKHQATKHSYVSNLQAKT